MSEFNYRCACGGILEQKVRYSGQPPDLKPEIWYVCPFCRAKRPSQAAAAATQDTSEDQVLMQA